jgi:ribosomal protein L37AE/L43A
MLDTPPVPHRCRRANRCPDRQRLTDTEVVGALIPAETGLCPVCTTSTARAITELPTDYTELDMLLGRTNSIGGAMVSGTRDLPIPIRTAIEAVQAAILHELCCWAESTAEVLQIRWDNYTVGHSRPGFRVQRAARLLAASLSPMLALRDIVHIGWNDAGEREVQERDGITGALVLLDLHHRTRAVAGRTRLVHRLPAPCPRCQCTALERVDGDDIIHCRQCEHDYTWDEYDKLCNALAVSFEAA